MNTNSPFRQFGVVFRHEYGTLVRSKLFRGITVVILLAVVLVLTIPPLLANKSSGSSGSSGSSSTRTLFIADDSGLFTQADFASLRGYTVTVAQTQLAAMASSPKTLVESGTYDDVAYISKDAQGKINVDFYTKRSMDGLPQQLQTIAAAVNIRTVMVRSGVPAAAITQALTAPSLSVTETSGSLENAFLPAYIMVLLLFYSTMAYGIMVASGVAQEKSSRAMELLITSARTQNLIFGKILGIGLAGLTQLAIWLAGMLVFFQINYSYWKDNAIASAIFGMSASQIALMLLFYLLGFLLFAAIYGAIGSLVSRTEDIQTFQLPVMLVMMVGLLVAIFGMIQTSSTLLTVFSFIPIFTPMCMYARMSSSAVPPWQVALSIVLTAGTVALFGWISAKIYRVGVLMYGNRPSLKTLVSALRGDRNA